MRFHHVLCRRVLCRACTFLLLCVAAGTQGASAQDSTGADSLRHRASAVLYVGHLNFDCYQDTVTGWKDNFLRYLPRHIRWGRPGLSDTSETDSACQGTIADSLKVAETAILYPEWTDLSGSPSFQQFNGDMLSDILLHFWGKTGDGGDTSRSLAIFGQYGIDTLEVLDLGTTQPFQSEPFFAMDLRIGIDLVDPAVRDLSGITSYELKSAEINVEPEDTTALPPPMSMTASVEPGGTVRIYPNPTGISAQVEGMDVPSGEYQVEIVAVNGRTYLRQDVLVEESGNLFRTLDVSRVPSGYYVVRLGKAGRITGTYPIVITR